MDWPIGFGPLLHCHSNHICGVAALCLHHCIHHRQQEQEEWVEKGKVIRSLMGLGDTFGTSSSSLLLLDLFLFLPFVFAIPTQYTFMQQPDSVSYSMPVLAKAIEGLLKEFLYGPRT